MVGGRALVSIARKTLIARPLFIIAITHFFTACHKRFEENGPTTPHKTYWGWSNDPNVENVAGEIGR